MEREGKFDLDGTRIEKIDEDIRWKVFGQAFRLLRHGAGFTLGDMARRLKVPVSTLSSFEIGRKVGGLTG